MPQDSCGLLHGLVDSDSWTHAAVKHSHVLTANKPGMGGFKMKWLTWAHLQVLTLSVLLGCKSEAWNGKGYIFNLLHFQSDNIMKRSFY